MKCHGCDGKGWVDSRVIGPAICPICKGERDESSEYNQDAIWIELRNDIPLSFDDALRKESDRIKRLLGGKVAYDIIVHILFDAPITPQGNLIFYHLQNQTITGPREKKLQRDQIVSRGYVLDESGNVVTKNDIPVGPVLLDVDRWCEEQNSVTHFLIDANRKGNPYFCDEDMLAMKMTLESENIFGLLKNMKDYISGRSPVKMINISLHLLP